MHKGCCPPALQDTNPLLFSVLGFEDLEAKKFPVDLRLCLRLYIPTDRVENRYAYMYIYIYVHTHTYMHTHVHMYMRTHVYMYVGTRICTYDFMCI